MEDNKKIVLTTLKSDDIVGDFIRCTECGRLSLIPCGEDSCCVCGSIGYNMWVDDEKYEFTISEVIDAGYNVIHIEDIPENRGVKRYPCGHLGIL